MDGMNNQYYGQQGPNNGGYNQQNYNNQQQNNMNQQNYNNYNNMNQQPNYNQPVNTPGFVLWLILGIVQTLCCCNFTGIGTLVLAIIANVSFKNGKYSDYQWQIKAAKIVFFIGIGLQVVGMLFGITTGMLEELLS